MFKRRMMSPWRGLRQIVRFGRDDRAAVAVMLALGIVPLVAMLGLATDAARGYLVKSRLGQAVDAAALAGGRSFLQDYRDQDIEKYFRANFPNDFMSATVVTQNANAGPAAVSADEVNGRLTVEAQVEIPTTFMRIVNIDSITVSARAVVQRTVNGMELVLVMDNTGSMRGSKMTTMKDSAEDLVNILYGSRQQVPNFWVGLVPYAATVNVGSSRTGWLEDGTATGASANLRLEGAELGNMTGEEGLVGAFDGRSEAEESLSAHSNSGPGTVGKDWGSGQTKSIVQARIWPSSNRGFVRNGYGDIVITLQGSSDNFAASVVDLGSVTLVADQVDPLYIPIADETAYRYHRVEVRRNGLTEDAYVAELVLREEVDFTPTAWKGCIEARPSPLDEGDTLPDANRFAAFHWPSTINEFQRERDQDSDIGDNDWLASDIATIDERNEAQNNGTGPNLGCPPAITPLIENKNSIVDAIRDMQPWHRGGTMANLGLAWGWRALSPQWRGRWGAPSPDTLPLDYDEPDMVKVIILLTDGNNEWYDWPGGLPGSPNGSRFPDADYTAYGRLSEGRLGTTNNGDATAEVNARMLRLCQNIKDQGIVVYTITFQVSNQATRDLYLACASTPDHYKNSPTNAQLRETFQLIASELSNLRLAE